MKYTQLLRDLRVYYSMLRRLVACFRHSVRRDGTNEHVELKNERGLGRTEGGLQPKFPVVARLFFRACCNFPRPDQLRAWKRLGVWRVWKSQTNFQSQRDKINCFQLEQTSQIYYYILKGHRRAYQCLLMTSSSSSTDIFIVKLSPI